MKVQNNAHLQDEHILWAVIDDKDLAGPAREHLRECSVCKRKVEQFRGELQDFEQKASLAVPPFSRPVRLPRENLAAVSHNVGWLPVFGAAAMAAFLVFFYFMGMEIMSPTQFTTLQNQESLLEDESLMREIAEIVEVPLPEDVYTITGDNGTGFTEDLYEISGDNGTDAAENMDEITGDNGNGFDEDFLEFVVPDILDDFQSEFI
jgi:hypothetical protein